MLFLQPLLQATLIVVTVDLYSGLENPQWSLTEAQRETLGQQLTQLQPASPDESPSPPALGYRGLAISFRDADGAANEARVWHKWIDVTVGGQRQSYVDEHRQLEQWLLTTAGDALAGDTIKLINEAGKGAR